jgi:hypothetical protein
MLTTDANPNVIQRLKNLVSSSIDEAGKVKASNRQLHDFNHKLEKLVLLKDKQVKQLTGENTLLAAENANLKKTIQDERKDAKYMKNLLKLKKQNEQTQLAAVNAAIDSAANLSEDEEEEEASSGAAAAAFNTGKGHYHQELVNHKGNNQRNDDQEFALASSAFSQVVNPNATNTNTKAKKKKKK